MIYRYDFIAIISVQYGSIPVLCFLYFFSIKIPPNLIKTSAFDTFSLED